jgi:outer membrane protein assembly factor BamB
VVSAYDLPTGRMRWSTPTGDGIAGDGVRPAGDVLLVPTVAVPTKDGSTSDGRSRRGTIALDAATGEQLWRSDGDARAAGECPATCSARAETRLRSRPSADHRAGRSS